MGGSLESRFFTPPLLACRVKDLGPASWRSVYQLCSSITNMWREIPQPLYFRRCVYATAEEKDVTSLCGDIRTCDVSVNVRLN